MAAQSAATIATNIATGEELLVDEQTYMRRMAACQKCPAYIKALGQCNDCGCFVNTVKGKIAGMKCPRGHWEK